MFLIFKWVAAAASAWLEVVLRHRSPSRAMIISLVIGSAAMTVWAVGIILLMSGLIVYAAWHPLHPPGMLRPVDVFSYLIAVPGSVMDVTSVGFWVFPLAAWLWRRRVASEATPPAPVFALLAGSRADRAVLVEGQDRAAKG